MKLDALVWHVFVNKKPLDSTLVVFCAVTKQFHQVRMLHHPEKVNFRHPFFMTLQASLAELLHRDFDFLGRVFEALDGSPVDAAETAFADHNGAAEVLGGGFEIGDCELSEVVFSGGQGVVGVPPGGG